MYGEDLDFTCAIARSGYRVQIDTAGAVVRGRPEHPAAACEFRGHAGTGVGTMAFSRYIPAATGFAGPRFWFFMTRSSFKRFLVPLHITTLVYVITLALLNPTSHLNLARVLFVLLFKAVPALVQVIGCTVYYGKARRLGWLPMRYGFVLLKHYYGLEAFLSFNARTRGDRAGQRSAPPRATTTGRA